MVHSRRVLDQVLIYDSIADTAFWLTPSQSWRVLNVYPFLERVDPEDPNYEEVAKLAGRKPQIYIDPSEDYGGDDA